MKIENPTPTQQQTSSKASEYSNPKKCFKRVKTGVGRENPLDVFTGKIPLFVPYNAKFFFFFIKKKLN